MGRTAEADVGDELALVPSAMGAAFVVDKRGDSDAEGKRKKKKRRRGKRDDVDEQDLEMAAQLHGELFGSLGDVAADLGKEIADFRGDILRDLDKQDSGSGDEGEPQEERKPAWIDEAEEKIKVKLPKHGALKAALVKKDGEEVVTGTEYVSRIRAHFAKLNPGTSWAELPSDKKRRQEGPDSDESDYDDGVMRTNEELVVKSRGGRLPERLLEVTRMTDANAEEPSASVVSSINFHRNGQLLLTAGYDKKLRFFQIDGKRNPKLQSIHLEGFPVYKAQFTPDGGKVIASSRRKEFVVYDVEQGKVERARPLLGREEKSMERFEVCPDGKTVAFLGNEGYILLASVTTKQLVASLKMNGSVRSLAFSSDGAKMVSCGGDGELYFWDLRTRRCTYRGRDEGCISNSSLAVSAGDEYLATGSGAGVVNVYRQKEFVSGKGKPAGTAFNLLTPVDSLRFNGDAQVLAMASSAKRDALRLLHLPSFTAFSNWPSRGAQLQHVHSLDFSPNSGFLAVGNRAGRALLFRLRHYERA